jgi:hypothetical protein
MVKKDRRKGTGKGQDEKRIYGVKGNGIKGREGNKKEEFLRLSGFELKYFC